MNDRELLELAAKAAGHTGFTFINGEGAIYQPEKGKIQPYRRWNPLTDDGDALRLAVKLYLWEVIRLAHRDVTAGVDIYAATRRAIVRAAAEIGKMRILESSESS